MKRYGLFILIVTLCGSMVRGWDEIPRPQPPGDISTGKYLYTKPDPAAKGGIKGKITSPSDFVVGVYAVCPNQPKWCYAAAQSGEKKREFEFTGLPMEKYDLIILYKSNIYEGLNLCREESTLTTKDRQGIEAQVQKSEPFFDQKIIFRLEGKTGKGEKASGIAAFIRNKESSDNAVGSIFTDHRRSVKVFHMMQVGPGWQMVTDREIYVNFLKPGTGPDIKDNYRSYLGSIRVTDSVKDLGSIDLSKTGPSKP
jgi:hypothetical protein